MSGYSGAPGAVIVLAQSGLAVPLTGTTAETTLATCTLPAGTMGANGQIEIEALFTTTNSANTKTVRLKFGGSTVAALGYTTVPTAQLRKRIANRNSAASQVTTNSASTFELNSGTGVGIGATNPGYTENTAADVTILITGQLQLGTETMTLESYRILLYPKG